VTWKVKRNVAADIMIFFAFTRLVKTPPISAIYVISPIARLDLICLNDGHFKKNFPNLSLKQ